MPPFPSVTFNLPNTIAHDGPDRLGYVDSRASSVCVAITIYASPIASFTALFGFLIKLTVVSIFPFSPP